MGTEPDVREEVGWHVFVDDEVRDKAIAAVVTMASGLADYERVVAEVGQARSATTGVYLWRPTSLSSGCAGIALLHGYLGAAQPGRGWEELAREFISRATRMTAAEPVAHAGLSAGSAGIAFALQCLAELDDAYLPAAINGFEVVAEQVLRRSTWRADGSGLADTRTFDLINGDTGTLAALLSDPEPSAKVDRAISALVTSLVTFCRPGEHPLRAWRVPPRRPTPRADAHGWYDLGIAHGVLGAAMALSAAYQRGYHHRDLVAALDNVYTWFAHHAVRDDRGINWPDGVVAEVHDEAMPSGSGVARPSWCYGAAGGAAALRVAGAVLGRPDFDALGLETLEQAVRRPAATCAYWGPTLCHGLAGLLQVSLRMAHQTSSPVLRAAIPGMTSDLVDMCDLGRPLAVADWRQDTGEMVAEPGVLTGTTGVALTLLAAGTAVEPRWDRFLLLSR